MLISEISILKEAGITIFPTYDLMIQAKQEYWEATNQDKFKQFEKHHELIHESEKHLETLYNFEPGKLRGAHLVFGSIRKMRQAFINDHLRDIVKNDQAEFIIKIGTDTRFVTSRLIDHSLNTIKIYATYQIRHNFYGVTTVQDSIACP
jgi:hypothetical protein